MKLTQGWIKPPSWVGRNRNNFLSIKEAKRWNNIEKAANKSQTPLVLLDESLLKKQLIRVKTRLMLLVEMQTDCLICKLFG